MHDAELSEQRGCKACAAPLRVGARFCARCGHTQTDSAVPPTPRQGDAERPSLRSLAMHGGELRRIAWLFGLLLLSSFVFAMVSKIGGLSSSPWPGVVTALVDALLVCGFVKRRPGELRPWLRLPRRDFPLMAKLLGASLSVMLLLHGYFRALEGLGVPMLRSADDYEQAGWPIWSMFLLTSVMPALFEELAFRGVIQVSLERVFSAHEAWLIQAALFSVLHLMPIIFPSHFLMGLWFGWLRGKSRSLYPGIIMHATWNALVLSAEL